MLTLTYFMTRSSLVAYAFEWGKTVTKSFMGKNFQQIVKLTEDFLFLKIKTTT